MTKKVSEFLEGDRLDVKLLVTGLVKGTTNSGAPYLSLTLQDSSKSIEAKMWDVKEEIAKEMSVGRVYMFTIEVINYRGVLQSKVLKVLPVPNNEVVMDDYVFRSALSKNELRNNIQEGINQIKNENILKLVNGMLHYYEDKFYDYPAASKIHHNFIGGLATHVSGMLKIGMAVCEIYPEISKDYLIAGIILHDLGKTEELSSPVVTEYTTDGKLLGHISIMDARLLQIGQQLKLEGSEELLVLRHMILSHHGQHDFGSPVLPSTLEAELLYLIDNIDAKINVITKAFNDIDTGEFTGKLFALENRSFYKHK